MTDCLNCSPNTKSSISIPEYLLLLCILIYTYQWMQYCDDLNGSLSDYVPHSFSKCIWWSPCSSCVDHSCKKWHSSSTVCFGKPTPLHHLHVHSIAKSFVVTCGPNFSMELSKQEGELTPEMIQRWFFKFVFHSFFPSLTTTKHSNRH